MARVRFLAEGIDFCHHPVQTGSAVHAASYPVCTGALSPEVKRIWYEAGQSHSSSVEVKNGGAVTPFPHMSSWCEV
jgi:hypothetical protein